ncbi:protein of unknown function [Pseudomonas sp. JV241A]|nr:protein of unknown function [Pseudomonas sp. JV241A]
MQYLWEPVLPAIDRKAVAVLPEPR